MRDSGARRSAGATAWSSRRWTSSIPSIRRLERGELYTLGKHYAGASATIELTPLFLLTPSLFVNLGDPSALQVTADLLSSDAGRVVAGDAVDVYGPALGSEVLKGSVKRVDPQGFTKVSSLGVDQQRVSVIVEFADGVTARIESSRFLEWARGVLLARYVELRSDALDVVVTDMKMEEVNGLQILEHVMATSPEAAS